MLTLLNLAEAASTHDVRTLRWCLKEEGEWLRQKVLSKENEYECENAREKIGQFWCEGQRVKTPLQMAVINSAGKPPDNSDVRDTVRLLLQAGANPGRKVDDDSLAALALRNNQVEAALYLLKHFQRDIQSIDPCNLPEPLKNFGLLGYVLTSEDAQLYCETLDWMSDHRIKLFPDMPFDVQMKLFAPSMANMPSVTITRDDHVPAIVLPSQPPLKTPFHMRKRKASFCYSQGPTGRGFLLRDGTGRVLAKKFGYRDGSGWVMRKF